MPKKKKPRKGFTRSRKEWEESIATHLGKFVDRLTLPSIVEVAAFLGLFYTYYQWEDGRDPMYALSTAFPAASIDYLLLKSQTNAGVACAIGHLSGRGLIELFQGLFP